MKSMMLVAALFIGSLAQAEVYFGDRAKADFEKMIAHTGMNPATVGKSESLYFGSDDHPDWGKMRMTYLYLMSDSSVSCWEENFYETAHVIYGCKVP